MAFKHHKRTFLAPVSTGMTSYILAEVEDTRNGEYKWGHNMLTIADCRGRIQLEFFLGTPKARRQSLQKINLLITTLVRFGHTLMTEAQAINNFEKASKEKKNGKQKKNGRTQNGRTGRTSQSRKRQDRKKVHESSEKTDRT